MKVHAVSNQYRGINAHLHSYWQAHGGWDSFHANHIADLMRLMSAQLLPLGYAADLQQSLQIRRFGEPAGKPESDVTIYDARAARQMAGQPVAANEGRGVAIPEIMSIEHEFDDYHAVVIYEYEPGQYDLGEPVAWVELVSPSNKPGRQDGAYYRDKRLKLLQSGLVFVELDYLHETPPTFERVALYNTDDEQSHPYHIFVVDPRPTFYEGMAYPYHFDVDMVIPTAAIPLNAGDIVRFDFDAAYQKTLRETLYGARLVDYGQLPLHFERYSEGDQARIVCRMLAVLKAARDGINLETAAPLPVELLPLDEAMKQFQAWSAS